MYRLLQAIFGLYLASEPDAAAIDRAFGRAK